MAAPTLHTTAAIIGSGTSVSIASTLTSPVNGNYRLMVVFANDRATNNAPISVTVPSSWKLIYVSPRGRARLRVWVYGQTYANSTTNPTVNVTFNYATHYAVNVARLSNFTRGDAVVTWPGTAFGGVEDATGQYVDSPGMHLQADAMRIDFWAGFYGAGLQSSTLHITPPAEQTPATLFRGSGDQGYATRASHELTTARSYIPTRRATMTSASANAVLSLGIGGWKEVTGGTQTQMGMARTHKGSKTVSHATTQAMGVTSTSAGGRSVAAATQTAMDLQQLHQRVYLTRTELDLQSSCTGSRTGLALTDTATSLAAEVFGHHVAGTVNSTTTMDLRTTSATRIGGGINPPSIIDHYVPEYEPSAKPLRFLFQNIRTGRWLNWDVPLVAPEITYTLSGPTVIRGRIGPDDATQVQGIDAWGTWLHVEEGGVIRASGILQPLAIEGDDLVIEAVGVHGYAIGMQFESEYARLDIDPVDVMRDLWSYLQSFPDSKLGVSVDDVPTPRRLGKPARTTVKLDSRGDIVYREVKTDAGGRMRVDESDVPAAVWAKLMALGYQLWYDSGTGERVLLVFPNDYAMATTGLRANHITGTATDPQTGETVRIDFWQVPEFTYQEAEYYEIAWWNGIDIGREIDNLAKQTPFDFAEVPRWADDRAKVIQHIAIGYPRLGTKRLDLRFAEDENLLAAVVLRESPAFYASQVIIRGAGEGRKAIRAQAGVPNPNRVRRVTSVTDQTITSNTRAQDVAAEELRRRLAALTISEISIDGTHPNAPVGSFTLGDDILVQALLPYFGEVQLWHRVIAYTWRPDTDEVSLTLRRSEQFAYGRVVTA